MAEPEQPPALDLNKHIRYWLRHLRTFLPTAYTSTDSNRMLLAWMTVTALDILGLLHPSDPSSTSQPSSGTSNANTSTTTSTGIKSNERADAIEWIYHCQHPSGGFRGFPGTDVGPDRRTAANACWDPANAAGTLFALLALLSLRDDLSRVDRRACRAWLARLQAEDGSFSEILGPDGRPVGTRDPRQMFLVLGSLYILGPKGGKGTGTGLEEVDVEAAKRWIYASQSFDGGVGQGPGTEAHGGYAYCSIASLILLGDIDLRDKSKMSKPTSKFVDQLTRWLVARQTAYEDLSEDDDEDDGTVVEGSSTDHPDSTTTQSPENGPLQQADEACDFWVGFAGRCNKAADTCYSFWVGDTIILLGLTDLLNTNEHRRFLLEKTEHRFGGFGKVPGDLPDILHSFFGLVALALMGQEGLAATDPLFGITAKARGRLETLRYGKEEEGGEGGEVMATGCGGSSWE